MRYLFSGLQHAAAAPLAFFDSQHIARKQFREAGYPGKYRLPKLTAAQHQRSIKFEPASGRFE